MPDSTVANRIFVGYPWRTYRAFWEERITELHAKFPLHFLAIGRDQGEPARKLLEKILDAITTSSVAMFDASGGNANVSLEYGFALHALGEQQIWLFVDENSAPGGAAVGRPIISDLAGVTANQYSLTGPGLMNTLKQFAEQHDYTKRFRRFCRNRRIAAGTQKFLLRIIRSLDGEEGMLRRELVDRIKYATHKPEDFINEQLGKLHSGGLIGITRGNHNGSRVWIT